MHDIHVPRSLCVNLLCFGVDGGSSCAALLKYKLFNEHLSGRKIEMQTDKDITPAMMRLGVLRNPLDLYD